MKILSRAVISSLLLLIIITSCTSNSDKEKTPTFDELWDLGTLSESISMISAGYYNNYNKWPKNKEDVINYYNHNNKLKSFLGEIDWTVIDKIIFKPTETNECKFKIVLKQNSKKCSRTSSSKTEEPSCRCTSSSGTR